MVFVPREVLQEGQAPSTPGLLQTLIAGTPCDLQDRNRLLHRLTHHGNVGPKDLLKIKDILAKMGNETMVCKVRHGLGVKLLSELQNGSSRRAR